MLTVLVFPHPKDPALHAGVPTGALSRLFWLLLLQFHDGSATAAADLLGLPHFAHGPQVHNWKGMVCPHSVGPTTLNSRNGPNSLPYQQPFKTYCGALGIAGKSLPGEAVLGGL